MTITKTRAQAEIRARGIWKAKAWIDTVGEKNAKAQARAELVEFLDGLTVLVRNLDVLLALPEKDETGFLKSARRMLFGSGFRMPFRVGYVNRLVGVPLRTISGHGWSWDEAFERAERNIEEGRTP